MQKNKKRGFTLIELLVVVLIIGILAAVALPQYQTTVMRSKYATLKNLTESILQAEELYYLENGTYTNHLENLPVQMPADAVCSLHMTTVGEARYVFCTDPQIKMWYQGRPYVTSKATPGERTCEARTTDLNSLQAKVCKLETGNTPTVMYNTYIMSKY